MSYYSAVQNAIDRSTMSLQDRCTRIKQIIVLIDSLYEEEDRLYRDGLTIEQSEKLFNMVHNNKSH